MVWAKLWSTLPGNEVSVLKPPAEYRTDRLVLRAAHPSDAPALQKALRVSREDFFPWLSFSAKESDLQTLDKVSRLGAESFHNDEFYVWRVWSTDGVMVGSVDLHSIDRSVPCCEIGYWVRSDYAGQGYAREFVQAALRIAQRDLKMLRVEARCDVRNARSWRLAERLGFRFEGTATNDSRDAAGDLTSTRIYALTA